MRTAKILGYGLMLLLASTSTASAADDTPSAVRDTKKVGVGGDLLMTAPVGILADSTGPLLGASLRGGYYVIPQLEGYGRIGYQTGLNTDRGGGLSSSLSNIPFVMGGRYFVTQPYAGFYANLELAVNLLWSTVSAGNTSVSTDTETRVGANIGAGYVISPELPINLGIQLALLNLLGGRSGEDTLVGISMLAGYEARF